MNPTDHLPPPTKSPLATASMVCGILAPFTCAGTFLPAVILGHLALSQIRKSGGKMTGKKEAKWGLLLGYSSFAVVLIAAICAGFLAPHAVKVVNRSNELEYVGNVQIIGEALVDFNQNQGTDTASYPSDIRQLDSLGYTTNINELLTVRSQHHGDWLYFWAADSEDPSAALLISPPLVQKPNDPDAKHVLLTTGGAVRIVEPYVVDGALKASPEPPVKVPAPLKK